MSSYIMHICISDIIKRKYNLCDKYLYGCILPDLQKEMGFGKDTTHFCKRIELDGEKKVLPQIEVALKELKDKMDKEVMLGYISHLIEDFIWFDKYIPLYTKQIAEDEIVYLKDNTIHSMEEYRNSIYSDYIYYAKYIIQQCNTNFEQVINNIVKMTSVEEKTLLQKNTKTEVESMDKPELIYKESVDNYINECINEIDNFISNMLL